MRRCAACVPFFDVDDGIARAYDTDVELGGSVTSSDGERAFEVAARSHSGVTRVNKPPNLLLDTPLEAHPKKL